MRTGKDFEKLAYEFLKERFDRVEWKSKNSASPIDFFCYNNDILFKIEAKQSEGNKVRLLPSQKDVDAIVTNKDNEILMIWKKDFDDKVIFDKMYLIKVSYEIKQKLDRLKRYKRDTYNDVIAIMLQKALLPS